MKNGVLRPEASLPDPLVMLDGRRVARPEEWFSRRRPELAELFQHFMYGFRPPAPAGVEAKTDFVEPAWLGGKATLKEVTIRFGSESPPIHLLLAIPNRRTQPAPAFLGLNFRGNHTVVDHPRIALPQVWMPEWCTSDKDHRAAEADRGAQAGAWCVEKIVERGYALATFHNGDVDPDRNDFTDGVHPHYYAPGQSAPGQHEWGTIMAWAWGLSRALDYLVTDDAIDGRRVAVMGHSRHGKAALVAAAFDERFAISMPHQAGCGGTAPSRCTVGETVKEINDVFPHWFCGEFKRFNGRPELLPFDQHCLVAMVAPRPVLFTNAAEDLHADPAGQFDILRAADPVYRLLGAGARKGEAPGAPCLATDAMPPVGTLVDSRLGYFIREGKHSTGPADWDVFLAYADKWL